MAILAALWAVPAVHAQPWLVRGTVTDAATGQPLPAATVQLTGTCRGTIANECIGKIRRRYRYYAVR